MMYGTTHKEQLDELKRELKMRESAYPRWVEAGRLTERASRHRLNCLRAVIEDFEERHKPQEAQRTLGL